MPSSDKVTASGEYLSSEARDMGFSVSIEKPEEDVLHTLPVFSLPTGQVTELLLANESGPCGGVKATLLGVMGIQERYGSEVPVSINARPTNGADSNALFASLGIKFGVAADEVGPGDTFVVSAHGDPRAVRTAEQKGARVFDSTCLFVHKTHEEMTRASQAAQEDDVCLGIVYLSIDGKDDHPELVGAVNHARDLGVDMKVLKGSDHIQDLVLQAAVNGRWDRIRIVSQTTNNADEAIRVAEEVTEGFRRLLPGVDVDTHPFNKRDICRTVTDRQAATRLMVDSGVETIIVVGSVNSKNTKSLVDVAVDQARALEAVGQKPSLKRVILANAHSQLPRDIQGSVGVVSGASTLDSNVTGVVDFLNFSGDPKMLGDSDKQRLGMEVFRPIHHRSEAHPRQQELAGIISVFATRSAL